jgi:RNA polymerase sigma-70 factor, ECF subfamily
VDEPFLENPEKIARLTFSNCCNATVCCAPFTNHPLFTKRFPSRWVVRSLTLFSLKRNKEAFHILYEELKIPLYKLVYSMIKDKEKTADIIQDTFIKVIRKIHQLQDIKKLRHWVFRIAVNSTINVLNKDKRISLPGDDFDAISDRKSANDFQLSKEDDQEEMRYLVLELVERLPVKQRIVFNLKYVENFKEQEIAEILDIPVGTVKSRLNISRERIKDWMKVAST